VPKVMQITLENYEAYFLDFAEGRLDRTSLAQLEAFLTLHPELKQKLEHFSPLAFPEELITYPSKFELKKFQFDTTPVNDKTFNDFCIAFFENQLNDEKSKELSRFISSNPDRKKDFQLFGKVYLKPQKDFIFPGNASLYKKENKNNVTRKIHSAWLSIAAGVAMLIAINLLFINNKNITQKSNLTLHTSSKAIDIQYPYKKVKLIIFDNSKIISEIINSNKSNTSTNTLINTLDERKEEIVYLKHIETNYASDNNDKYSSNSLNPIVTFIENQYNINYRPYDIERFNKIKLSNLKNKNGKFSAVKIIQLGLAGINRLTHSNMKLTEKRDESGKIMALSFESESFEFHTRKNN
jgi:hypothetical protein